MVEKDFLVEGIGKEHFFLQNFRESFGFFWYNNFHPFFEGFPFSEHDEKIIFADLIKGLHLIEPFFDRDEFNRFRVNKFGYSLTWESVIVDNVVFDYLWVRNDFHVVVIIGVFPDHVNELFSCQFFLTDHFEESCHLWVLYWNVAFWVMFYWSKWRFGFNIFRRTRHSDWVSAGHWRCGVLDGLPFFIVWKWVASCRPHTCQSTLIRRLLMLGLFNTKFR